MVTDLLNAGPAAASEGMDCSELATEDRFEYRFPKAPSCTEILRPNSETIFELEMRRSTRRSVGV